MFSPTKWSLDWGLKNIFSLQFTHNLIHVKANWLTCSFKICCKQQVKLLQTFIDMHHFSCIEHYQTNVKTFTNCSLKLVLSPDHISDILPSQIPYFHHSTPSTLPHTHFTDADVISNNTIFHLYYFFIYNTFHRTCVCQTSSSIFSYFKANTVSPTVFDHWTLKNSWICFSLSHIRHKDFCAPFVLHNTQGTPQDSETGWTGELWSKTNLLKWQWQGKRIFSPPIIFSSSFK